MFQSFETTSSPALGPARVTALRERFDALGIDGFLVPRADEFQGEYVPASAERLAWLTGFTGSAGIALILREVAVVFVDGRYTTQLAQQVDQATFTAGDLVGEPPHSWIAAHGPRGLRLGVDPWLHSGAEVRRLETALAACGGSLVILDSNPLDALWHDRPAAPMGAVSVQQEQHAGRPAADKIAAMAKAVADKGAQALLVADPSSVAWIFNIRGADVPHTPHPLARAIITAEGAVELFIEAGKLGPEAAAHLDALASRHEPSALLSRLAAHAEGERRILVDGDIASIALTRAIEAAGGIVVEAADPARLPRAIKNAVELRGSADAHVQDGAAMVRFLHWLDTQAPDSVSEISAVTALEAFRARVGESLQNPLKDISFDTISGAGEHGAVIHYRVTTETDRRLKAGELFLIDSGAQYVNGTTDITRTVAIGAVPQEQKKFFTLVLKGMIAISAARFPKGTRGCDLDPLARIALWKAGADYAHGTGHGVGSYLSVHEGPQRISRVSTQELLPGMILSNEPGYYRPGAFGIRIENLIYVTELEAIEGGDLPMMGFETLTWCPIDRRLILKDLLTAEELAWVDAYHAGVRAKLQPLISEPEALAWLEGATAAL
ncbi:aminopeptidase P family protein [Rhizobium sp. CSW-27]|uniref:aminopeptidase P family protein n=1 Tax=Rhizobium sp. CSW-27 TaxID=2839985 RepID=UPI001C028F53|nr:aminopeptidase P family protein [Rhizobium sp. CSW-27]MBT9371007.1 aminopeptidase P family protein [Rhizobium sp. CSW-27]